MKKYESMSREELLAEQTRLNDLKVEVKEELDMMLSQSGQHVPTTAYLSKYKQETAEIEEQLSAVKQYLEK